MLGAHAGVKPEVVRARLERHHHFLERAVAGALPDAVDGALHLPGAFLKRGEAVRHGET